MINSKKITFLKICFVSFSVFGALGYKSNTRIAQTLPETNVVQVSLTTPDRLQLLAKQNELYFTVPNETNINRIRIDESSVYQTMYGFGFDLTDASAIVINRLPRRQKNDLLKELFSEEGGGIGISYLRISIGSSSLSTYDYTYDEVDFGDDQLLMHFSLAPSRKELIPVLQQIVAIAPEIKIMACPFTPPTWMKNNRNFVGGKLKVSAYSAYADYFVKYIRSMQAAGIRIDAITPQNEPNNNTADPSMAFSALEEANFIKNNLGPAFRAAGLTTKIVCYDHNADHPEYPETVLSDREAYSYVDGSAFHFYAGNMTALSEVHQAFPTKGIYFTEQYTSASRSFESYLRSQTKNLIIGASRNWASVVLGWTLAGDADNGPHKADGCKDCLPAITVSEGITRNIQYYVFAHASRYIRPGAVRISSNVTGDIQNVAFRNLDGSKVLIVLNTASEAQSFEVLWEGKSFTYSLAANAVATFRW